MLPPVGPPATSACDVVCNTPLFGLTMFATPFTNLVTFPPVSLSAMPVSYAAFPIAITLLTMGTAFGTTVATRLAALPTPLAIFPMVPPL